MLGHSIFFTGKKNDLIVFDNIKFIDYIKEIYPSELNAEKADRLDDKANYLNLTFITGSNNRLDTKLYDERDDFNFLIFNLTLFSRSISDTFRSLSYMQNAAHIMMTLNIVINVW